MLIGTGPIARTGGPLWPGKAGSGIGGKKSEDGRRQRPVGSVKVVVGYGSGNQKWRAFMAGQTWVRSWRVECSKGGGRKKEEEREQWPAFMAGQSSSWREGRTICQWDLYLLGCCPCFYPGNVVTESVSSLLPDVLGRLPHL